MRQKNVAKGRYSALALSQPPLGSVEAFESSKQFAVSGVRDGFENIIDGLSYFRQLRAIRRLSAGGKKPPQAETQRTRKNTYRLMAYPAAGAAVVSLYGAAESMFGDNAKELNTGHIIATSASLAISGLLIAVGNRMKKTVGTQANPELQKEVADFQLHAKLDWGSSAIALVGSGLHAAGLGVVEQFASAGFASYQAKKFWPSEKNLQRGLHQQDVAVGHGHSHHHDHGAHEHVHMSDIWESSKCGLRRTAMLGRTALGKVTSRESREQPRARRRWRVAMAGGLAAVALAVGIGSEPDGHLQALPAAPGVSSPEVPLDPPRPAPLPSLFAGQCIEVQPGDTQWHIVEAQLTGATGEQPDSALVNAATLFTAHENLAHITDPHAIDPANCVVVPTEAALQAMHQAADMPASPLGQALDALNTHFSWDQAIADNATHAQITAQLQHAVAE